MNTKRKKDDYDLINSNAISKHCRTLKYQFNTEELAVLVYRCRKMNLDEKIIKYQDLIDNYPDMEVIKRVNCKHYDSVKTMIKNEINRDKKLYEKFIKEEEHCVYICYEYNKSSREYSNPYYVINHTKETYNDAYKSMKRYINEYDDTISFTIVKKYFGKKERKIFAVYNVINKIPKLYKIYYDEEEDYLDINNIFVFMPTPFKKGDILIVDDPTMRNYGDDDKLFVLEHLFTWRENLKEYLARGNCDSSDMVGYGYYLYENKAQIMYDNRWDYDSFEYYVGKIEGKNRILKAISSMLKGDIDIGLLIQAYDVFKSEYDKNMPDYYTDDGLEKAGFTELDIQRMSDSRRSINEE